MLTPPPGLQQLAELSCCYASEVAAAAARPLPCSQRNIGKASEPTCNSAATTSAAQSVVEGRIPEAGVNPSVPASPVPASALVEQLLALMPLEEMVSICSFPTWMINVISLGRLMQRLAERFSAHEGECSACLRCILRGSLLIKAWELSSWCRTIPVCCGVCGCLLRVLGYDD